jgi:predicted  nucleic acid-binding Zn-ribbon protein
VRKNRLLLTRQEYEACSSIAKAYKAYRFRQQIAFLIDRKRKGREKIGEGLKFVQEVSANEEKIDKFREFMKTLESKLENTKTADMTREEEKASLAD